MSARSAARLDPGSQQAGAVPMPCPLWVGFAAALNLALWRLNPGRLG